MSLNLLLPVVYVSILLCCVVQGTLTPDGTVPLDCGSQRTFTCSVTGVAALWTISELSGISVTGTSGQIAADNNARINTTNSSAPSSSTITITGFTKADDEGTIQCINLVDSSVQGRASILVGPPLCSVKFTHVRIDDFTRTTRTDVTWQQPPNTPPVTSTTVTYCPTSSPNCGNSTTCTSPCTIGGLNPCEEYNITITPTNNCGSATGCIWSMVAAKDPTPCQSIRYMKFKAQVLFRKGFHHVQVLLLTPPFGIMTVMYHSWQQPPNTPPVTSTTVTYCPTLSPNCGNSMTCTSPCTISGLLNDTEYQFTVIPNNNCGSATGCTGNTITNKICSPDTTPTTGSIPQQIASIGLIIGVVMAVVLLALVIAIIATILICCFCLGVKGCKSGSDAKNKPMREEQPRDDYADPQTVRDNKEMTEGNGITYAALQFSEEAGGNGKNDIHCKEKLGNVQYSEVERLQV